MKNSHSIRFTKLLGACAVLAAFSGAWAAADHSVKTPGVSGAGNPTSDINPVTAAGTQCGLRSTGSRGEQYTANPCQGYDVQGITGSKVAYYDNPSYTPCSSDREGTFTCGATIPAERLYTVLQDGVDPSLAIYTNLFGSFAYPAKWVAEAPTPGCSSSWDSPCPIIPAHGEQGFDPARLSYGASTPGVPACPPAHTLTLIHRSWDTGAGAWGTSYTCMKN